MKTWAQLQQDIPKHGHIADHDDGVSGCACIIRAEPSGRLFKVIASWGAGWDHVSVTRHGDDRVPFWHDMAFMKQLFWNGEELVVQMHPPESVYVDIHPGCLHLWKNHEVDYPIPGRALV